VTGPTQTSSKQAAHRQHCERAEDQKQHREITRNLQTPKIPEPVPYSYQTSLRNVRRRRDISDEEVEIQEHQEDLDSSYKIIKPIRDRYKDLTVSVAKEDSIYEKARIGYRAPSKKEIVYHTMREGVEAAVEAGTNVKKYYEAGEYFNASMVAADAARNGVVEIGGLISEGAKLGLGFAKRKIWKMQQGQGGNACATFKQILKGQGGGGLVTVHAQELWKERDLPIELCDADGEDEEGEEEVVTPLRAVCRIPVPCVYQSSFEVGDDEEDMYNQEHGLEDDFSAALHSTPIPITIKPDEFAEETLEHITHDKNNLLHRELQLPGREDFNLKKPCELSPVNDKRDDVGERRVAKQKQEDLEKQEQKDQPVQKEEKEEKVVKEERGQLIDRAEQKTELGEATAQEREATLHSHKNEKARGIEDLSQYPDTIHVHTSEPARHISIKELRAAGEEVNACADQFEYLVTSRDNRRRRIEEGDPLV
jgi:hypothetical protein